MMMMIMMTMMMVGSRVHFQLQIAFPVGTTDMIVELFAPDNETVNVISLCSPNVTFVGTNMQYSNANVDPMPRLDTVSGTYYVSSFGCRFCASEQ